MNKTRVTFESATDRVCSPRVGTLTIHESQVIATPHYLAIASRGVIPHLSQDVLAKHTDVKGVYMALEDFIERTSKKQPPILHLAEHDAAALRHFTSLSDHQLIALGPRRLPPVVCPMSSTATSIPTSTSVGFAMLENEDYVQYMHKLKPDIIIGLADMPYGEQAGTRRKQKMSGRTEKWTQHFLHADNLDGADRADGRPSRFVPILPIEREAQNLYLDMLAAEASGSIDGLALYHADSAELVPESLAHLPRLSMSGAATPQDVLHEVELGADICCINFINTATDAGIALDFVFPAPSKAGAESLQMGIDMWTDIHATVMSPLVANCPCYACQKHHRAYIHHLLSAKEMLAWVLLQIHNLKMMDMFFTGIRRSIEQGTFTEDVQAFKQMHEAKLPVGTGQGPRIRGYQRKSEGPNEPKQNALAYRTLNDAVERKAEGVRPDPSEDAEDLENKGFGAEVSSS